MRPPRQFYFTPTYSCNSDCLMCGVAKEKRDRGDSFELDHAKKLVDRMELGASDILEFSGGEPTIYRGFRDLIRYAKERYNPRIFVLSHGRTLANAPFVASLKGIGIERFTIPIFSFSESTHDYIT